MSEYPSFFDLLHRRIVTVSELTGRIADTIDNEFRGDYVWVMGEVSNFNDNYSSGHWYFTLKDKDSQISSVCFKSINQYIKFLPQNGMEVICCGVVGVYSKQGRYQLTCYYIEPKGVGAEAMALEQLKERLLAEGLFDQSRKRPLPFLPELVGVVTSPSGAAIRDIIKVLSRRFPGVGVLISPTRVQGAEAPADIARALRRLYEIPEIDLIIVARGGGSKEDLWAFNEELVAREIARSPVPVISAVGHETDITISDLVADIRAATPSMAAELAVREKAELLKELDSLGARLRHLLKARAEACEAELVNIEAHLARVMDVRLRNMKMELAELAGKLDALSPLKVLERGYSVTQKMPGMEVVRDSSELVRGDTVLLTFLRGRATCSVEDTS